MAELASISFQPSHSCFASELDMDCCELDIDCSTGGSSTTIHLPSQMGDSLKTGPSPEEIPQKKMHCPLENLKIVTEGLVAASTSGRVSLLDLLRSHEVSILVGSADSALEQLRTLRDSVAGSEIVAVQGSRIVMQQSLWKATATEPGNTHCPDDSEFHYEQFLTDVEGNIISPMWGCVQSKSHSRHKQFRIDRQTWILTTLHDMLQNPPPAICEQMDTHGFIPISSLFAVNHNLGRGLFHNTLLAVQSVTSGGRGFLVVDEERQMIRLATPSEQLCATIEICVFSVCPPCAIPVSELLKHPMIHSTLSQAAASSEEDESEFAYEICLAVKGSELLEVIQQDSKNPSVAPISPENLVLSALEWLLKEDYRTLGMLRREGEVPLSWVADRPRVRTALAQAQVQGADGTLETLRNSIEISENLVLDEARSSMRLVEKLLPKMGARPGRTTQTRRSKYTPTEKDARTLRQLLKYYFEPFSLQHNQLLMSIVEAQRREHKNSGHSGYLKSSGQRPVFNLSQIRCLPRVSRIFEMYDPTAGPAILAAALQATDESHPVRVNTSCNASAGRGAWTTRNPCIELTYVPNFRFLETMGNLPELKSLLTPEIDPYAPSQSLPASAFSVVSYSVSSDLSHSQSPKAAELLQEVLEGGMDPKDLTWASRQQRFRRQLLQHSPDMICLQGLQSIGFLDRCSEVDLSWFECENEPSSNHLVHLYRELSKLNYSVMFSPTMRLPGSAVVCFGNAIFWKRSRWSLQKRWNIESTAVCAELISQIGDLHVAVCCTKSAASYAKDFGDTLDDEEVLEPLRFVQESLLEETSKSGAHPIWCGEFGVEPPVLLPGLAERRASSLPTPTQASIWQSANRNVLGEDPWSSVAQNTRLLATDLLLHDDGLEAIAALGGLQEELSLADFLKAGHPSDHLFQMAVFREPRFFQ